MESLATRDGKYEFTVSFMCVRLLVSRSGFYEWRDRGNRRLLNVEPISALSSSCRLLSPRRRTGTGVCMPSSSVGRGLQPELVRSIMRELGLVPCQPRPWRHSLTSADAGAGPIPDLVNRDFTAECRARRWSAISRTFRHGRVALSRDRHRLSHEGHYRVAMDDNYKTPLIAAAITMAAQNCALPVDAIFHSDRGSNYTSQEFAETLRGLQIDSPSAGPGFVTTMRWLNRSTPR